tara:strand:+ start:167 stop:571 length:405 start_codon:yes stop_codon:yes gene_type:complete
MKDQKGAYIFKDKESAEIVLFTYEKMTHNRIGEIIPNQNIQKKIFKPTHSYLITLYNCETTNYDFQKDKMNYKINDYLGSATLVDITSTIKNNKAIDISKGYDTINKTFPISQDKFHSYLKIVGKKRIYPHPSK